MSPVPGTPVTQSATNLYTTLAHVKDELGIVVTTYDEILTRMIDRASRTFERITGRIFTKARITEKVTGYGRTTLLLSRRPIVTIHSIEISDAAVEAADYEILDADAGILYNETGWPSTASLFPGAEYEALGGSEKPLIVVDYTGGYILPADDDSNLPGDLEMEIIELVKSWYRMMARSQDVRSEHLGDYSVTYDRIDESFLRMKWERWMAIQ